MPASVVGSVAGAAAVYGIALAAAVLVGCATLGFSCSAGPNPLASAALALAALFATGLVLMGAVISPAALLLRRVGMLYWWSLPLIAAAAAPLPLLVACASSGDCGQSGLRPLMGAAVFASLCGELCLWQSRLRHSATQPAIVARIAAQSTPVKAGLIFTALYVAVVVAAIVFVATASGDMAGIVFLYLALPWTLVGDRLIGFGAVLVVGLALNAVVAFSVGYAASRLLVQVTGR